MRNNEYAYYAISNLGYRYIYLKSENPLIDGEKEFKRRYGEKEFIFCSLVDLSNFSVQGKAVFDIPTGLQFDLYQQILYGWRNLNGYSRIIIEICQLNNLNIGIEHVKYLYINNIAKKFKYTHEVTLSFVIICLIDFMMLISDNSKQAQIETFLSKFRQ